MSKDVSRGRRRFLCGAFAAATAIPVAGLGLFAARPVAAADRPQAEDGHAQDYVNDAADAAGHDMYEDGQMCENCAFWTEEVTNGWGDCAHPEFHDVLVNANGWCAAYAPAG